MRRNIDSTHPSVNLFYVNLHSFERTSLLLVFVFFFFFFLSSDGGGEQDDPATDFPLVTRRHSIKL